MNFPICIMSIKLFFFTTAQLFSVQQLLNQEKYTYILFYKYEKKCMPLKLSRFQCETILPGTKVLCKKKKK